MLVEKEVCHYCGATKPKRLWLKDEHGNYYCSALCHALEVQYGCKEPNSTNEVGYSLL